jgi:hypothetical protein
VVVVPVVVVVVPVVVEAVAAGEAEGLAVEAWTRRRLSLLVDGPFGSDGVVGLVLVSARGAFWMESAGLRLAAGAGGLVCAFTAVRAMKDAAPAQSKMVRRFGIG